MSSGCGGGDFGVATCRRPTTFTSVRERGGGRLAAAYYCDELNIDRDQITAELER